MSMTEKLAQDFVDDVKGNPDMSFGFSTEDEVIVLHWGESLQIEDVGFWIGALTELSPVELSAEEIEDVAFRVEVLVGGDI